MNSQEFIEKWTDLTSESRKMKQEIDDMIAAAREEGRIEGIAACRAGDKATGLDIAQS
jgi:hypothetical protein